MKRYMKGRKIIIELGSGNGCIREFLKMNYLTDIIKYPGSKKN